MKHMLTPPSKMNAWTLKLDGRGNWEAVQDYEIQHVLFDDDTMDMRYFAWEGDLILEFPYMKDRHISFEMDDRRPTDKAIEMAIERVEKG